MSPAAAHLPEAPAPALLIEGLTHSFGSRKALDAVSLTVTTGEFAVLLGLNGAGKTTLFALATRLYSARHGRIRIFGHDLDRHPSAALARIGVVFQQATLDLDLSVEQNLFYHASLHGLPRREAALRIAAELERVELVERRHDKVRQLSAGQRRRIEIARALMHRPSLLLLDEPTVGLDVASRQYILDHVKRLCREQSLAVLWATHLIDEADPETSLNLLHCGKLVLHGTVAEVIAEAGAADLKQAFQKLTAARGP